MRVSGLVVPALALLLGGCSSYAIQTPAVAPLDPQAPVPRGLAEVCVVRPGLFGLWGTHVVRDNGSLVGATRGRGWFCYRTRPGHHRVTSRVDTVEAEVELDLASGQRAFLEQSVTSEGPALAPTFEARAREELAGLSYAELVRAPGEAAPRPGTIAVDGHPPSPPPSRLLVPSPPPRHRPNGGSLSLGGGLGAGFARTTLLGNGAPTDHTIAAGASFASGYMEADRVQFGVGVAAVTVGSHGVIGFSLRTAVFPAGTWNGPVSDFNIFLELGAGGRVGSPPQGVKGGGLFLGAVGLGWEGLHTGSLAAGPFIAGKLGRGDENVALVLLGMEATLYTGKLETRRDP